MAQESKTRIEFFKKEDSRYPSLLREIPDAPVSFYLLGELPQDNIPRLAIVGTRKATTQGKLLAKRIAKQLSDLGFIIVSGLAMGIDAAAHEGALDARAKTVAVLANDLDSIYPRQNENLAKRILEFGGGIISEYPAGTPAMPYRFLERNRLVSGLSLGVVIIEAPAKSGALVTARLAAEQGREVFVFPGPPDHPNYQGSHKLIRDGARLVTSVEDILEDLGLENRESQNANRRTEKIADKNQLLIIQTIREAGQPLNIDKIIELTKLEPQAANQSIALLTIQGIIKETERGYTI